MHANKSYSRNVKSYSQHLTGVLKFILLSFAVILLGFATTNPTSALTYEDTVVLQFTWNPSISINLSGDLLIPNLTPGNSSDSNIITITVGSNDANGYTLYSNVGNSTSSYTDLRISPSNSTNKFTNLSSNKANLAAFADNTWGYSYCNATSNVSACDTTSNWVSGSVGSTSAGYNGLPLYNSSNNATGIILADTTTANQTTLKFKIGAKAATSQASGLYTNVVNFTSVAKVVTTSYTLSYVDNSSEATGMPSSSTTGTTTNGAFNVTSTVPSRANYTFKGWCTVNNSSDPTTCTGALIQPSGLYAIGSSTTTFTGSVYATWQSTGPVTIADATYMQEVNSCPSSLTTGQIYTITDSRDGTSYRVAKLADNNCWMLDNLALDLTDSNVQSTMYDSANTKTNASYTTLGYLFNGGGTNSDPYAFSGVANWVSGSSYSTPLINLTNRNSIPSDSMSTTGGWKTGGYYNYCAASAGSRCYGNGASDAATEDICPANWRIPSSNDFSTLYTTSGYNTYASFRSALNLPLSGSVESASIINYGSYGYWWTSTRYDLDAVHILVVNNSNTVFVSEDLEDYGESIRCVLGS